MEKNDDLFSFFLPEIVNLLLKLTCHLETGIPYLWKRKCQTNKIESPLFTAWHEKTRRRSYVSNTFIRNEYLEWPSEEERLKHRLHLTNSCSITQFVHCKWVNKLPTFAFKTWEFLLVGSINMRTVYVETRRGHRWHRSNSLGRGFGSSAMRACVVVKPTNCFVGSPTNRRIGASVFSIKADIETKSQTKQGVRTWRRITSERDFRTVKSI